MIKGLPGDADLYNLENKIRTLVSDLLTPVVHKIADHERILQKSLKSSRKNKKNLQTLRQESSRSLAKLVPYDLFNKKIEYLLSETKNSVEFLGFTLSSLDEKVTESIHNNSDLKSKFASIEESQRKKLKNTEDNYRYIREFQDVVNLETAKMHKTLTSFSNAQQTTNDSISDKISKINVRLNEINTKALPGITFQIEKRNVEIEEVHIKLKELMTNRVLPGEFKQLRNKLDYDLANVSRETSKELREIKSFLAEMLPLEISFGVSDVLLKVTDPRNMKKLLMMIEANLLEANSQAEVQRLQGKEEENIWNFDLKERTLELIREVQENANIVKDKCSEKKMENSKSVKKIEANSGSIEDRNRIVKVPELQIDKIDVDDLNRANRVIENSKETEIKAEDLENSSCSSAFYKQNEEIDALWREVKKITQNITNFEPLLFNIKQEFLVNFSVLSNELIHFKKFKSTEQIEIHKKYEELDKEAIENAKSIKKLEKALNKLKEFTEKAQEAIAMIYSLLMQDEEDRQSLQLTCYTEGKQRIRSPSKSKPLATLKPECLSCTAQNPMILSAFKMACLNYCPSDITYNFETFERKKFINRLGEQIGCGSLVKQASKKKIMEEMISRAKSATRVRTSTRHVLDTSLKQSLLLNSPTKMKK